MSDPAPGCSSKHPGAVRVPRTPRRAGLRARLSQRSRTLGTPDPCDVSGASRCPSRRSSCCPWRQCGCQTSPSLPGRKPFMSLHGLLDVVVRDPALDEAVKAMRRRPPDACRPRRPARRPPLRRRRAGPRDRADGARRHRDRPGGRGPGGRAAHPAAAGHDRGVPVLGDAAARAALAPLGHRGPTPRRAAAPGAPEGGRPGDRAGLRRRRADPLRAPAAGQGARRPGAGGAAHRAERRSRQDGRGARGGCVLPGRTGREAR